MRKKKADLPREEWDFEAVPEILMERCWNWEFRRELHIQDKVHRREIRTEWEGNMSTHRDFWESRIGKDVLARGKWPKASGATVFCDQIIKSAEERGKSPASHARMWELIKESVSDLPRGILQLTENNEPRLTLSEVKSILREEDQGTGKEWLTRSGARRLQIALAYRALTGIRREEIWIEWEKPDSALIEEFKAWLRENRKKQAAQYGPGRGARPFEKERADLKALGALRLLQHYGSAPAAKTAGQNLGGVCFSTEKSWSEAKRRALRTLDKLRLLVLSDD
jgi:hypothetical protein